MGLVDQNKAPALFAETAAKITRVLYSEVKMLSIPLRYFYLLSFSADFCSLKYKSGLLKNEF